MRPLSFFLGLPASLLLLVGFHVGEAQANARGLPTAIRKMSPDAGEKLLQEYLAFAEEDQVAGIVTAGGEEDPLAANSSAPMPYFAPFAPHFDPGLDVRDGTGGGGASGRDLSERAKDAIARLEKRGYACPTGTSNCSSVGYPNSCCQTGTECVQITDTGLGPVGCCPVGISCSGSIACSGSQEGCPSDIGGGCCIDGYVCASIGCVQSSTATATVMQTSTIVSVIAGSPTTTVTTITVSQTSSASASTSRPPSTSSKAQTTTTTTPATSSSSETQTSTTATPTPTGSPTSPGAPVRPTSISTTRADYCPTGFYGCSAVHGGGCCQTGRDCQTTSCPPTASTAVVSSGGETVAVPLTDVPPSAAASACAGGWSLCPSGAGATAGCCPAGYGCGTASCFLAKGGATASVAKELTGSGVRKGVGSVGWMIPVGLGFAFGMALV